jgi:diguanylate cyclase
MTGSVRGVEGDTGATTGILPGTGVPSRRVSMTARRRVFYYLVSAVVLAAVASGLTMVLRRHDAVNGVDMAVAVAAFAAAQLARITLRVGSETVLLAWGEVGIVAVLCLVPPVWVPAAVAAGAVLGHGYRLIGADDVMRARVLYVVGCMTCGGVAAVVVAVGTGAALGAPTAEPVPAHLHRPVTFVPLVLAALAYFATATAFGAVWIAGPARGDVVRVWVRVARGKRLMLAGNVLVALAVAVVIGVGHVWLMVLVPVLLLLRRVYAAQLGSSRERQVWAALADATRALNRLEERGVLAAAMHGARQILGSDEVEVVLYDPAGRSRHYVTRKGIWLDPDSAGRMDGAGGGRGDGAGGAPQPVDDTAATDARYVIERRLVVGHAHVGDLRLRFRLPVTLAPSEQHAFSTFADAVAAALHDGASHRQLQAMTARSAYDAVHDPLTGLVNRSTLLAQGNAELRRGGPDRWAALVLLDIDGFRAVNDALSHNAGDDLLRLLARRLADGRADGEMVGRLGGDEFAMLLTGGATDEAHPALESTVERARAITSVLAVPAEVRGVTIAVEASAGVVVETASRADMTELLRRADIALHQAKNEGIRVAAYDATNDAWNVDRLALLADMRDALAATDQLTIALQPIVDLATGSVIGAEALARWHHPRRGLVAPLEFVAAIEHSELASGFTEYVLDRALAVAAEWAGAGHPRPVSVNLCARCMLDRGLPDRISARLAERGVAPELLILETTETVMAADEDVAEQVIAGLRAIGVQLSVDHFGTGTASLRFLTRFPVNEVKIDRSFVSMMLDSTEAAAIVRTSVELARDLGLRVVAEGVERSDQRAALMELGVGAAQGFLFHPALPVAEATALLD